MLDKPKITLNEVDWMRVRMLSITGRSIHLTTEEGPLIFDFATEAEATAALHAWFIQNGCNPKASPFPPALG